MHTGAFLCRFSCKFLEITAFSNAYAACFVYTLHAGGFQCLQIVEGVGGGKKVRLTLKDLATMYCWLDKFYIEKQKKKEMDFRSGPVHEGQEFWHYKVKALSSDASWSRDHTLQLLHLFWWETCRSITHGLRCVTAELLAPVPHVLYFLTCLSQLLSVSLCLALLRPELAAATATFLTPCHAWPQLHYYRISRSI